MNLLYANLKTLAKLVAVEIALTTSYIRHLSQLMYERMSEIMDFTERTSYQAVTTITEPTLTPQCPEQSI